jgi:hypothetical protein
MPAVNLDGDDLLSMRDAHAPALKRRHCTRRRDDGRAADGERTSTFTRWLIPLVVACILGARHRWYRGGLSLQGDPWRSSVGTTAGRTGGADEAPGKCRTRSPAIRQAKPRPARSPRRRCEALRRDRRNARS